MDTKSIPKSEPTPALKNKPAIAERHTTYTVKSLKDGFIWLFKYDLSGNFSEFKIVEGILTGKQKKWLFSGSNFPEDESILKTVWMPKLKENFEIIRAEPVLDFENLWNLYNHKVKKHEAEKNFNKLKDGDKIKCFLAIPGYSKYLAKTRVAKAHLSTFINQRYFEDDWQQV